MYFKTLTILYFEFQGIQSAQPKELHRILMYYPIKTTRPSQATRHIHALLLPALLFIFIHFSVTALRVSITSLGLSLLMMALPETIILAPA